MRFKLKLKKSRQQYNVTSRSLFVISVEHLLDSSTNVECTLSSESTGQECLENVCQRLSIGQPEFFGLRYLMKGYTNDYRWVDLEMPLSRQLEKYAATPRLFLRVMYYVVGGVQLLTDEATRYYYFLQVRGDVVEGRIQCDPKQAVLLAVCARHAEYDGVQRDQHTVDYLKAMLPLPRRFVEAGMAEKLAEEVLQHTVEMAGVGQAAAEEMFLRTAQQLEGYGQERFRAKDRAGQEVLLGNSSLGIAVIYVADEEATAAAATATAIRMFHWRDIRNVFNLRQSFTIECNQPENTCEFTLLQDAESGRYFWKLCVLQHYFYSKYEQFFGQHQQQQLPSPLTVLLQSIARQRSNSTMSLIRRESNQMNGSTSSHNNNGGGNMLRTGDSCDNLLIESQQQAMQNWRNSDQYLAHEMPMAPHRWKSQDSVLMHQHKSYSNLHLPNVMEVQQSPNGGHGMMNGGPTMVTQTYNWQAVNSSAQKLAGSNVSLNGIQQQQQQQRGIQGSSSCLDLTGNPANVSIGSNVMMATKLGNLISNSCTNVNQFNERDYHTTAAGTGGGLNQQLQQPMLPGYRKAPDYETAMRQKYQRHVSGSQPDVYQASSTSSSSAVANQVAQFHLMRQQQLGQQHQQLQKQYPDVTQTSGQIYNNTNTSGNVDQQQQRYGGGSKLSHLQQQQQQQHLAHQQQIQRMMRLSNGNIIEEIKPPPPPYSHPNRLSSTSTPDLALISHRSLLLGYRGSYVSGSSPDLVSSRTLLNNHHLMQLQQQHQRNSLMGGVGGSSNYMMKSTSSIGPQNYHVNGGGGGITIRDVSGATPTGMRHSHSYLAHGTYENLTCIGEQQQQATSGLDLATSSHSNLYQSGGGGAVGNAVNGEHMVLAQQQQPRHSLQINGNVNGSAGNLNVVSQPNVSQSKLAAQTTSQDVQQTLLNNSGNLSVIEPIYENLPLSCWNGASGAAAAALDRRSSSNSSSGGTQNNNNTNQNQVTVTHTTTLSPSISTATGSSGGGGNGAASSSLEHQQQPTASGLTTVEVRGGSSNEDPEMRDRASSVQSAPPGGVRGSYRSTNEDDVMVIVEERAGKVAEEAKRPVSKTFSNPVSNNNIKSNNHVFQSGSEMVSTLNNGVVVTKTVKGAKAATLMTSSPLNRSQSANLLDSSHNELFTDSGNISASTSNASIANTTAASSATTKTVKEKRRGIWSILSRGRNSSNSSSSSSFAGSSSSGGGKHKSATLGKSHKNLSLLTRDEEDNLKHRWSTGLPRMEPLSANMSKEQLCRLLEQKKNDEESLFREFERIPRRKENAKYESALHEENQGRNADNQCLPHDDNRVRLLPTRNNRQGYVNASHITATVGSNQRFYIVAESPFDAETMNSFWQCVWEADVYLIIQLSNELQYVPSTSDKCLEFGQYQVWREFSQETEHYVTSKIRIYHVQAKRYRIIWYLHYSDWSEQNIPRTVAPFLDFLEELSSVRMASVEEIPPGHNTNPPVLIHCNGSAGGRSGVALAADLLLFTLDHNQDLDIPRVVGQLRHQRDNIVPSLVQYKFIYSLLVHYLKQTRLI